MPDHVIAICALFGRNGKPLAVGTADSKSGKRNILPLSATGTKILLADVDRRAGDIKKIYEACGAGHLPVITTDFKPQVKAFNLSLNPGVYYSAHDIGGSAVINKTDWVDVEPYLQRILNGLLVVEPQKWHKIIADAAIVYQSLENSGIYVNEVKQHPIWSQHTFSGRSKCTKFSVHGLEDGYTLSRDHEISNVLLHFDWMAADVNIAGYLAKDKVLLEAFVHSDPYSYLEQLTGVERSECKVALLAAINQLDVFGEILRVFPSLHKWLMTIKKTLDAGKSVETILGRKFTITERGERAALNGILQGSIALAMARSLRRIWDRFPEYLLFETHDSVVMSARADQASIRTIMDGVSEIMTKPFVGLNTEFDNVFFPLRVSLGKYYKNWQVIKEFRPTTILC